uniref:G-protein coupled receptors family 1 profile domain-containing protein n=1 Tax=Monopterus albus TaxID=43700 RepID=A0A3Q3JSA6_MONAL
MDNNLNETYITLDGYVEVHKNRYLYFMIMFTAYSLILCINSTVVSLIVIHKNLHEPMYIFIAALLLNSVLLSTSLYPKLLIDVLSEKQIISYSACLFQWHGYFYLTFSEISLLAVMAYDRYVSICKPLQYPTIMRKSKICFFLVLACILPLCGNKLHRVYCTNWSVVKLSCVDTTVISVAGQFFAVILIFIPLFFVLYTYLHILLVCRRSSSEFRGKALQTCLPHIVTFGNYCISMFSKDYFLCQLRELDLIQFYRRVMESVLCTCITVWFGSAIKQNKYRLQQTIRTAERIIGASLPSQEALYTSRVTRRADKVSADPSHPGHNLFELLSGQRYRSLYAKTTRHKFLPPGHHSDENLTHDSMTGQ